MVTSYYGSFNRGSIGDYSGILFLDIGSMDSYA